MEHQTAGSAPSTHGQDAEPNWATKFRPKARSGGPSLCRKTEGIPRRLRRLIPCEKGSWQVHGNPWSRLAKGRDSSPGCPFGLAALASSCTPRLVDGSSACHAEPSIPGRPQPGSAIDGSMLYGYIPMCP
jgi:hypothetical protein